MDAELRDRWLDDVERRLADSGRRAGAARTAVVELLARDGQCLLGAHEIIERLRPAGSPASVYRALDELHALGLLRRLDHPDGIARYEIVADPARRHHHFIDDTSGEITPFTDDALERAIGSAARRLGVQLAGHDVILRGRRGGQASQSAQ